MWNNLLVCFLHSDWFGSWASEQSVHFRETMAKIQSTKDLFLWCMSAIYLCAFTSLYVQIPGLYGDGGILPARAVLKPDGRPVEKCFQKRPSLMWFTLELGLKAQEGMDLICIMGCMLSLICLISRRMRDSVMFALLWFLYMSVYEVGAVHKNKCYIMFNLFLFWPTHPP